MRDYGRVYSSFWQSPEMRALPEDPRTLALYLLTCPHANLIGCFRLSEAYAADDLQWSSERVSEGFAKLCSIGFMTRDEGTKWVLIHKYLKWNSFENANVAKAAQKAFDLVPAGDLKPLMAKALLEFGAHLSEPFAEGLQTLVESFANPEPEPIQSLNQNQSQTGTISDAPPAGATSNRKPKATPKAKDTPPTVETWEHYADAYERRYGVAPVRNAKGNGQIAQFVGRLGADDAPHVAEFYVGHQRRFYVESGHSVDLLLKDAEKLRTEWATGRAVTSTQALQADKTQTNRDAFAPLLAQASAREAVNAEH